MLRVWNVSLIVITFALCLLGTFLVRSGILQSIHAFGASTVGTPLLVLIAAVLIGSTALIVSRLGDLRSERRIESLASREAVFLVNNLLLIGLCVVVFWGTFFPLISEAVTGERSSLAAPWFDRYTVPLAIMAVLFTGIGPLLAWRRVSRGRALRLLGPPTVFAGAVTLALVVATSVDSEPFALVLFAFAAFALMGLAGEFVRGASAQRALGGGSWPAALGRLVSRNRRRYGGYVVHVGVVLAFIAVAASSSFQTSVDVRMRPGDTTSVGDYEVTYREATSRIVAAEQRVTFGAVLDVERDGTSQGVLVPSRNYYASPGSDPSAGPLRAFFEEGQATSEIGRRAGASQDLWTAAQPDLTVLDEVIQRADAQLLRALPRNIAPEGPTPEQLEAMRAFPQLQGDAIERLAAYYPNAGVPVDFRLNINPFVIWIWIGGGIAVIGGLVAAWPTASAQRRRVADVHATQLAQDLGRA